jgi:NAD-dependent SIR2 family protein deacetylase
MADTAISSEEEKREFFDTPDELEAKVEQLAQWVRESSHFTVFTGAGISTSAGIPDFRSGYNTVLPTGPGAWEKAAKKVKDPKKTIRTAMQSAVPTPTHMSYVKLMQEGLLKFLISQNVDGLHRKSGIAPAQLAEVHGNTNLERCKRCGKEYMRDHRVRTAQKVHDHLTGRKCDDPACRGELADTIINFGENLDDRIINAAFENAARSDLCLAMGSSLRVTPAADVPKETKRRGGKLVIVNIQKTPLDHRADMVINAFCDTVMQMLLNKLQLEIPPFKLIRRLKAERTQETKAGLRKDYIKLQGVDSDGCPYTLFPKIEATVQGQLKTLTKEPFMLPFNSPEQSLNIRVFFQGHYQEPPLSMEVNVAHPTTYLMVYDLAARAWEPVTIV